MKTIALILILSGVAIGGAESAPAYWWVNFLGMPLMALGAWLACRCERKARCA